jgi:type IV pilus assembly protein PilC
VLNRLTAPLAAQAAYYQQLGLLLESGFDLSHALRVLSAQGARTAAARAWRGIAQTQRGGLSLSAAIRAHEPRWATFDLALIEAGERSGRLAACCSLLGRHYTQQASLLQRVLADATYPLVLLHALIVLRPVPALFAGGSLGQYLAESLGVLLLIYLGLGLLRGLWRAANGQIWRGRLERVLGAVPVLGAALRTLALARLAAALEALISAGLGLDEAWRQAGAASGSSALAAATARFAPALARGQSSASALADSNAFPPEFVSQYHAAEAAGRLDHCLRGLAARYTTEGFQSLRNFCRALPQMLLLLIALLVGFQIVHVWLARLPAGD